MTNINLDKFYEFIKLKKLDDAETEINRLSLENDKNYFLINQQAFLLFLKKNFVHAILKYQESIDINPQYYENYSGICACFFRLKKYEQIVFFLNKYLKYNINNCEVYYNLGVVLSLISKLDEAIINFKKCIKVNPNYIVAYNDLGLVFLKKKKIEDAILIFEQGLKIDKKLGQLSYNLANCLIEKGKLLKAIKILEDNLIDNNSNLNYLSLLANCLLKVGKISRGYYFLDQILKNKKKYSVFSFQKLDEANLLETKLANYFYQYNFNIEGYFKYLTELRKVYDKLYKKQINFSDLKLSNKIKVAFLSSDFRSHAVSYQIFDVLKILAQDKDFEIFIYNNSDQTDEITADYKVFLKNWKNVKNFPNDKLISLIRSDNIQILVDLSGYTLGHRMPVFFCRVAPIQVSWCGYLASSGMKEIDYIIADKTTIPFFDEKKYTEKIYRLKTWSVLNPINNIHVNKQLPAFKNKFISFACFNNLLKINPTVIKLWAKILCKIKDSKLYLFSHSFSDQDFNVYYKDFFIKNGVKKQQLCFEKSVSRQDILKKYNSVDISLDPFPYSGGTTSLESYWMCVPVLTKKGEYFISKSTESINQNIGMENWIASDNEEYFSKAINFCNDLIALQNTKNYLIKNRNNFIIFNSNNLAEELCNGFKKMIKDYRNA
jgi:predicted O-linked N-acetylglucosamine transferase (SPINDLY family)